MKVRNGFVSNSSSSSFLIAMDEESYKDTTLQNLYAKIFINKVGW